MYKLLFHPLAVKQLKKLHPIDRKRISDKLEILSKTPQSSLLNIRKLINTQNSYRLRTGDVRAIFEINPSKKIIYIWNIDYRGNIY